MTTKINPIIPLSYNIADGRRKYVLFCGAGVSKDAGIPTGWDVLLKTLRLIRAQDEGKNIQYSNEDMEAYYNEKYKDSDYSEIIGGFFPSNEEQREFLQGLFKDKSPGKSHKLIAEWVKVGLIRFIVTTNFDSFIEYALDDAGLRGKYSVISNGEQVSTSMPWDKEEICRIYKIHGTIEQGKIRNTQKDLQRLDKDIEKDVLDVIERHGVIVLGYAGNDLAVLKLFNKRKFKGYTLYWTIHRNQPIRKVENIVRKQDGLLINIENSTSFLENVLARAEIARQGIEQTDEAVAKVRFKNLAETATSDVEIKQNIDGEKKKLIKFIKNILNEVDEQDHHSLWEGFVKIFNYSFSFLLLVEQIIKFRNTYWSYILPIFEEIHALNENQDRGGKNGVINYFFYCILEITGAMLLENQAFKLLKEMLELKRLNRNKDGVENILAWEIYATFINIRNEERVKKKAVHSLCL